MKKYNHAFTIAFEVNSNEKDGATEDELMEALEEKLYQLKTGNQSIIAACDAPFDTIENKETL